MAFPGLIHPGEFAMGAAVEALAPAFARSLTETARQWLARVECDQAQLWHLGDLWAITCVRDTTPQVLQIVAMSGEYTRELMNSIEAWGRSIGCAHVFFEGRPGWQRRLLDYRVTNITMQKEL